MLKEKYNKLLLDERKKVGRGVSEIIKFIKKNNYPLFGSSVLELITDNKLNNKKMITIVVKKKQINDIKKFFSTFYRKHKLFFQMKYIGKDNLVYSLNLVSVLSIKISNYNFELNTKNNYTYVNPLYGLMDLYRIYLDPVHYSVQFASGNINFESENKFTKNLITQNIPNIEDSDISKPNQKLNNHLIKKYLPKNKNVMLTGYLAYDMIMDTKYFQDKPIEIISYNADEEVNNIKKYFKFNLKTKLQTKQIFPYFKKIIHFFSDDGLHLITLYEYKGIYNTNELNEINIANVHGVMLNLIFNKLENKKYIVKMLKHIIDNNINILHKGRYQVFQNKYVDGLIFNGIKNRV